MNAFARTLRITAVQSNAVIRKGRKPDFLVFSNTTTAITVVIGATKRNQARKRRAKFQWGQNGIWRSIGKEKRKRTKPRRAGKH